MSLSLFQYISTWWLVIQIINIQIINMHMHSCNIHVYVHATHHIHVYAACWTYKLDDVCIYFSVYVQHTSAHFPYISACMPFINFVRLGHTYMYIVYMYISTCVQSTYIHNSSYTHLQSTNLHIHVHTCTCIHTMYIPDMGSTMPKYIRLSGCGS